MRDRNEADDIVQGAYNRALLDLILPSMRRAALEAGYALTVHGSLNRDIDLVAIPWVEHGVWTPDALAEAIAGAIRGVTGRCNNRSGAWTEKPHGRVARTLMVWCGQNTADLDLSIMPTVAKAEVEGEA